MVAALGVAVVRVVVLVVVVVEVVAAEVEGAAALSEVSVDSVVDVAVGNDIRPSLH